MKPRTINIIPGVVLAIPNEYHLFATGRDLSRCKLCGLEIASAGGGPVTHAKLHVRRGELERVTVNGLIRDADGSARTAWHATEVGLRTPGAGGYYLVRVLTRVEDRVDYESGEMPQWGSFSATEHEAAATYAHLASRKTCFIEHIAASTPILPSMRETDDIKRRIERAARQKFPRMKRDVFFEHGHWWLGVDGDERHFTVVDASGHNTIDGFSFVIRAGRFAGFAPIDGIGFIARNPVNPYPHMGACSQCRAERRCNYCGEKEYVPGALCTNGRCARCHPRVCTPGGIDSNGHGFGTVGGLHFQPTPPTTGGAQ